jgi:hypothetical protein
MTLILRLMKLHRLCAPAGEHGSDAGGTDVDLADPSDDQSDDVADDQASDDGSGAGDADEAAEGAGDESEDDLVITIGDEAPVPEEEDAGRAPAWVKELRKSNREKDRRIRELEAKVAAPAQSEVVVGEKPTLASCDFDEAKYEADLEAWHELKRSADEQKRAKVEADNKAFEAWQTRLTDYSKAKTTLKVKDFDDAEASVQETLNVVQQGVLLTGAENAAMLVYALGKNPKMAKEVAAITDPVKFAFAIAKLETKLKVTSRKAIPTPERTLRGGASGAAISGVALDQLKAKAEKTGDYTQYFAAKRAKKPS